MTITASLFKETKGPLYSGPFPPACEKRKQRFFKSSCKSANRRSDCFPTRVGISEKRPTLAGPFPRSSLLSSALASKDQGGSPGHASRLFALGSIRMRGQPLLWPSHHRDRGHPWRE
jgi:hypothetical protein